MQTQFTNSILLAGSVLLLTCACACGGNPRQTGSTAREEISPSSDEDSSSKLHAEGLQEGENSTRIAVQLRDGSRVFGYPLTDSITLQTRYASLTLPFTLIRTVEFEQGGASTRIFLSNGERLQGTLEESGLTMRSLVGTLPIPRQSIHSVTVFSGALLLDSGLVAFYPFRGNANDESGHNRHGTVRGAQLCSDRFGVANNAYSFDGKDTYISFPDRIIPRDAPSFTISLWLLAPAPDGTRMALYIGAAEGEASIQLKDGEIGLFITLDGNGYSAQGHMSAGAWTHVVAVYRRGISCQLWIGGELKNQNAIPAGNLLHALTSHSSSIGSYAPAHFNHAHSYGLGSWLGAIDQVRIYNRVLEPQEVSMLFNSD